jgi:glycosyltransferase involved in cell wall biosynthesis
MNPRREVIMICAHTLDRHTRLTKLIKTLNNNNNYLVTYLGWDRDLRPPRSEKKDAEIYQRELLLRLKSHLGTKSVIFLPIWWIYVFVQLIINSWDIAHVAGFISIPPVIVAAKIKNKIVIYEVMDTFADLFILPSILRNILIKLDKLFMHYSSVVILADEEQIEEYGGISASYEVMYDSPNISTKIYLDHPRNDIFTLFFAGFLNSSKALNLDKIFLAIDSIDGVKLIIAGYGDLVEEIKKWVNKMPEKIEFLGEISYSEVLERSCQADLLFVLRDTIVLENKYICGSKMLEAMMCSTPIIVNKGTSTAKKVLKANCGLVVDASNIIDISNAIVKLRDDPLLCKRLGSNGRNAYDEQYSWEIMGQKLLDLYRGL